jgi:PRD1 phage membrane DNA delivery
MSDATAAISAIVAAIIGLAVVAVLVSKNAQTGTVIGDSGTALSQVINAAVSPVSSSAGGALTTPSLISA